MNNDVVNTFLEGVEPRFAAIVTAIDNAILNSGAGLERAIKWKQLTYAKDGDYHHWICAIVLTKKAVGLRFHFGGLLSDPDRVFRAGSSKFLRSMDFAAVEGVDAELVSRYIHEAMSRLEYFKANWKQLQEAA